MAGVSLPAAQLRQTSIPIGILDATSTPAAGTTVTTLTAPDASGAYRFVEWTLNGIRLSDSTGAAANPCVFAIPDNTDAVAIYLPSIDDTDSDGLPDWWERRYFGNLATGPNDNPDGDTFPNLQEYQQGRHPRVFDPVYVYIHDYEAGGVSRRREPGQQLIQNWATYGFLKETSNPAGALLSERVVTKGTPIALTSPPAASGGYHFTGWLYNGVRYDQGLNVQPITVTPLADVESYTARYVIDTADVDADTVPDWQEWLFFESLAYDYTSDPDGDGFTWAAEKLLGYSTLTYDQPAPGGISRRRGQQIYVDTTGRLPFRQTSLPATILEQTDYIMPGSVVTVPSRNGFFANYIFSWWDLNGVRQEDPSGVALPGFQFILGAAATATAHYIDPTVDADGDGIKDYIEWTYYGTLANGPDSDTDGDGLTFAEELARNQSPRAVDTYEYGGVSRRRSASLYVQTTGQLPLRLTSTPASIFEHATYYAPGTAVTLPNYAGSTVANYKFAWWTLNGQRLSDPSGTALATYTFYLTAPATATAVYIDPTLDTDSDGISDWQEWTYYGALQYAPTSDTDADGLDFATELLRGQSPRVADIFVPGGVSRRRAPVLTINPVVAPAAPAIGSVFATDIGTTTVTLRALVNPLSAATTANFDYGLTLGYGTQVASTSVLNGFSVQPMDGFVSGLQPNTTYHFRVVATNTYGQSTSLDTSFTTLPDYSGFDGWRALYAVGGATEDDDHDGVVNLLEYAFGLNPTDPSDGIFLPQPEFINGYWHLRYTSDTQVTGITVNAQWSKDLLTWQNCTDSGTYFEHVFWTPVDVSTYGRLFIRWSIQLNAP